MIWEQGEMNSTSYRCERCEIEEPNVGLFTHVFFEIVPLRAFLCSACLREWLMLDLKNSLSLEIEKIEHELKDHNWSKDDVKNFLNMQNDVRCSYLLKFKNWLEESKM